MEAILFLTVGVVTLICFFMYDKTQRDYTKRLRSIINEQSLTLEAQQRLIDGMMDEVNKR